MPNVLSLVRTTSGLKKHGSVLEYFLTVLWQWQPKSLWKFNWSCIKTKILVIIMYESNNNKNNIAVQGLPYFSWQSVAMQETLIGLPHSYHYKHHCTQVCHWSVEPAEVEGKKKFHA